MERNLPLNTILYQDTLEALGNLPAKSVQTVIADPPYYNVLTTTRWDTQWSSAEDWLAWSAQWLIAAMRVLKKDGLLFCFGQLGKREHPFLHLMSNMCKQFAFHDLLVWNRMVGYQRGDSFSPAYEMILILKHRSQSVKFIKEAVREPYDQVTIQTYARDRRYKNKDARLSYLKQGKFATNIINVPSLKGSSREKCGHPSQKPIQLLKKLILCSTTVNDTVLDPFIGSGSTAIAAAELGRQWIGIEKNPNYVQMANERIEQYISQENRFNTKIMEA